MEQIDGRPMAGRTVLVTGGTGGIGRATAVGLAAMGASVAIVGRDRERTEDAAREIREAGGGHPDAFVADMSVQAEVRRLADEVLGALPRIDVLVNNVGGYWDTRHVTADGLERTFALNHLAPFLLTHLLLDRLRAERPRAHCHGVVRCPLDGPDRLRRPRGRAVLLRDAGLQPVQARQHPVHLRAGQEAGRRRRHRQRPASGHGADGLRGRGRRHRSSGCSPRSCARS